MKILLLALAIFSSSFAFAQKKGDIYGEKPNGTEVIEASKLDAFMDTKPRISTTIRGVVTKVIKSRGGWFTIDAGGRKVITVHFSKYNIDVPIRLAGHTVIVEGVAERQFAADDSQHIVGQKTQHANNPKGLTFEATGILVEK
ncbi:DUF4920 domain-containing protein [Mucilaginibacter sp.]